MDEEIIDDIADAFAQQLESLIDHPSMRAKTWQAAILEDVIAMAIVIKRWAPTYDMRYFYKRAGYPEPYPVHLMEEL